MLNFSLRKWYLDIADDKGNVYIGYRASLKWGGFALNGFHHLFRSQKLGVKTRIGLDRSCEPVFTAPGNLAWSDGKVSATWEGCAKSFKKTLFNSRKGKIVWHCLQPKARARVVSPDLSFAGWGYTELIDITIPVWELPFKALYWGRSHSKNHFLVWVKWEGKTMRSFAWLDGKLLNDLVIKEKEVSGRGFKLQLGENVPLRQGMIASTIFGAFEEVTKLLPKNALSVNENKWYNKSFLKIGTKQEAAITIYEKVLW